MSPISKKPCLYFDRYLTPHYGAFPALIFEGKNMDTIYKLQASISIDPY